MVENGKPIGSWNDPTSETGRSEYLPILKALLDYLVDTENIDPDKIALGGCSAGGLMRWQFTIANPDVVAASFPLSPIYAPTDEELDMLEARGIPVWVFHGFYDELVKYEMFTGSILENLKALPNIRVTVLEYVRFGDHKIASLNVGGGEMGQHASQYAIGQNMLYNDGTPYGESYPERFTDWLNACFEK